MNIVIFEPMIVLFREGLKVCLVSLLIISYLEERQKTANPATGGQRGRIKMYRAGLLVSIVLSFVAAWVLVSHDITVKQEITNFIHYSFGLLYLFAIAAVYQSHGLEILGPVKRLGANSVFVLTVCFAMPFFLFSCELTGALLFIRELAHMKGPLQYVSAGIGLALGAGLGFTAIRHAKRIHIGAYFDLAGLLFSLAVLELMAGGIKGFAEMTMVSSIQSGVMKMFHDLAHQFIVILMIPDHPLLTGFVWRSVGFLFGSTLAIAVALAVLTAPLVLYLVKMLFSPVPEMDGLKEGPSRRAFIASVRRGRKRRSLPVLLSLFFVLASWYTATGESTSVLYLPEPAPVVPDKGAIIIPLREGGSDLFDGRLHKFSLTSGEDVIRIAIIKKPNGRLFAGMDACEVCPPEGYGQSEGRLVCRYCNTPIPLKSLGGPGGCNPIPLSVVITDSDLRIRESEILTKWRDVKSGKTRSVVK